MGWHRRPPAYWEEGAPYKGLASGLKAHILGRKNDTGWIQNAEGTPSGSPFALLAGPGPADLHILQHPRANADPLHRESRATGEQQCRGRGAQTK